MRHRLDDFAAPAVRQIGRQFIDNPDCWALYLWGDTGSRKTSLAIALLLDERERVQCSTQYGAFLPAYRAVDQLRDFDGGQPRKALHEWQGSPYLILDDLGKHRDTPHVIEQLLFLLHWRYDWQTPGQRTVITANMSLQDLAEFIDPATARRLEEGCVFQMKVPDDE